MRTRFPLSLISLAGIALVATPAIRAQNVVINVGSAVNMAVAQTQGWNAATQALDLASALQNCSITGMDGNGNLTGANLSGSQGSLGSDGYGYQALFTMSFDSNSGCAIINYTVYSGWSKTTGALVSIAYDVRGLPGVVDYMKKVNPNNPNAVVPPGGNGATAPAVNGNGTPIGNTTPPSTDVADVLSSWVVDMAYAVVTSGWPIVVGNGE